MNTGKFAAVLVVIALFTGCSSYYTDTYNTEKPDLNKKRSEGIDLFASGSDMYWSVDLNTEDSTTVFLSGGSKTIKYKTPVPETDTANRTVLYRFNGKDKLILKSSICNDNNTDEIREFSAELIISDNTYSGCAKYIIASVNPLLSGTTLNLNDIWALKSLNGIETDRNNFKEGIPMLELHLNEGRFYGKADCNEIYGRIEFGDSYIYFRNFTQTKKICEGNFEEIYINTLKSVDSWKIGKMQLILKAKGKEVLRYNKID